MRSLFRELDKKIASLCDRQVDGGVKWLILSQKGKGGKTAKQKQVLESFIDYFNK